MESTKLTTPYVEMMNSEMPHSYYPRPLLKRLSHICLNGKWDFGVSRSKSDYTYGEKILVPFSPEAPLSGICREIGKGDYMHYRRSVYLDGSHFKGRILLHFGAVDQECEIRLNGKTVGAHKGGYIPFTVELTEAAQIGENILEVTARDTLSHDYPYGKQRKKRGGMWYTPVSGIWQTVWIECVPQEYIREIISVPTENGAKITVKGGEYNKKLTLLDSGEVIEFSGESVTVIPRELRLWTPEEPNIYRFTVECGEDRVESYFAIRTVDVREVDGKARICLNGRPYIFNGLLDQGYYPDGIFLPATVEGFIKDIELAKAAGFNMLRKHIKIEPQIFYYLCDTMGIAVFQDMVNNGGYSFIRDTALPTIGLQRMPDMLLNMLPKRRKIFNETMLDTAKLLMSHPSVVYYTIFNEGWGQFAADKAYSLLKSADETRIIDTTSGWFRRRLSDVDSRHIYFRRLEPKKLDGKPLVISEFGGYSYRAAGHLFGKDNYGYSLFSRRQEYEDAVINLYLNEVLPLAESGASAFVYTQLSDVEDETNGIVTYDRKYVKVDLERMKSVMEKINKAGS